MEELNAIDRHTRQRIVFSLDKELYGVEIEKVKEIMRPVKTTRIPKLPEHIEGVMNLRGRVVPIVNLRKMFGLEVVEDAEQRFLIVEYRGSLLGVSVDRVHEVIVYCDEDVLPPPVVSRTFDEDVIEGVVRRSDDLIILLSLDRLLMKGLKGVKSDGWQ